MQQNLKYLIYVLRHKWYVFQAGLILGVPIFQLLIHDLSKFSVAEWAGYVNYFYNENGTKKTFRDKEETDAFVKAWHHHEANNPHHWGYWIAFSMASNRYAIQSHGDGYPMYIYDRFEKIKYTELDDDMTGDTFKALAEMRDLLNLGQDRVCIEMPEMYLREMVADWAGAGKGISGQWDLEGWYAENKHKISLHQNSRDFAELLIFELSQKLKN